MVGGRAWLIAHSQHAGAVTEPAWNTVADFSILWQLFEAKLCDSRARNNKLKAIADSYAGRPFGVSLDEAFAYWKARYTLLGNTTWHFDDLFGGHDGREVVATALLADTPHAATRLEALLLIVLRLRNNLFHGGKEIETFNDQKDNLDHATAVLIQVLEWKKADDPQAF